MPANTINSQALTKNAGPAASNLKKFRIIVPPVISYRPWRGQSIDG
jgi:hypothetical protein